MDAKSSEAKSTLQTPAAIVKSLYGIGVRAAPRIAIKALS